ncbi:MAG: hypothetical protein QMC89_00960 [Candidatus Hodarchaeaceae archaeon]|nr:hypothetical protein [Candidatus Hodarchaeaceae archaeon]
MTVDSEGKVGAEPKIALDGNGHPHVAYNHWERRDLKYAGWTGSGWKVETVDWEGSVGRYPSIALDERGYPHISYSDTINYDVKYARWDGKRWVIERVDGENDVGFCTSMTFDRKFRPHIAYWDFTSYWLLKHAWRDVSGWRIEVIDNLGVRGSRVGLETSIKADSRGNPHISYSAFFGEFLKYGRLEENGWTLETLDGGEGFSIRWVSMALDKDDRPHIAYYFSEPLPTPELLKYARWTGSEWRFEVIDNVGYGASPPGPSIALDSKGYPHIAHGPSGPGVEYIRWTGGKWEFQIIEDVFGCHVCLVLDENDLPHIAYYDGDNWDLKYATLSEAIGPVEPQMVPKFIVVVIVGAMTIAAMLGIIGRRQFARLLFRRRS